LPARILLAGKLLEEVRACVDARYATTEQLDSCRRDLRPRPSSWCFQPSARFGKKRPFCTLRRIANRGKPTPSRFSRHYANLAALGEHAAGKRAITKDDLRVRVVAHKTVFFPSAWAHYETAAPGSFRLIPDERRLADLERDYREMQEMYFGTPHTWAEIVARLRKLETAINLSIK
jgi:hypothetical protein